VLVLGGTGFLGSEIAHAFTLAGSSATVVGRHLPTGPQRARLEAAELIVADVQDPFVLSPLVDRVDHVVYAVGATLPQESNANPGADAATVLPMVVSLLELLRYKPAVGLSYLSSGGTVYGNPATFPVSETAPCHPITSYGIVKLAAEHYIGMYSTLHGVSARILRVGNAYGPHQPTGRSQGIIGAFLAAARAAAPVRVFGDGGSVRDYVHAADVARAVVELTRRSDGPPVVNVGSGIGHSILEVLDLIRQVTGASLTVEHLPERGFDVRKVILDVAVLSGLVGWAPLTLEAGIEQTWHDLRSRADLAASG
jgi:UDP-glucose 4-epimerase